MCTLIWGAHLPRALAEGPSLRALGLLHFSLTSSWTSHTSVWLGCNNVVAETQGRSYAVDRHNSRSLPKTHKDAEVPWAICDLDPGPFTAATTAARTRAVTWTWPTHTGACAVPIWMLTQLPWGPRPQSSICRQVFHLILKEKRSLIASLHFWRQPHNRNAKQSCWED